MRRAWFRSLGALASVLAVLSFASPAQAHDYLVSSTPEQGATLTEPPSEVVLEFNTSIGQQFAQVAVVGADGTAFAQGAPTVDGAVVTQAVAGLPAGTDVTISYRVVSSDGHPIGGTVPFTIAASVDDGASQGTGESPDAEAAADADPADGVTTETSAGSATDATAATSQSTSTDGPGPALWLGLAALALLAALGLGLVRRRSRSTVDS